METENTVSMWIGNFASREELDNYIDLRYDDDGEIVSSKFYDAFQIDIDDIDDYLIEKEYCDSRFSNVYDHIIGASYADVIIDNLKKIEDALAIPDSNSIILLYNYKYCGQVKEQPNIKFIATVNYR
ncbi:immunity 22 family protein [Streptococcus cristatus]|uniref:immunity 22 family protein n=1 Tax=Streptococcus cristatus TaxID=45634 RepID=UPI0039C3BDF0